MRATALEAACVLATKAWPGAQVVIDGSRKTGGWTIGLGIQGEVWRWWPQRYPSSVAANKHAESVVREWIRLETTVLESRIATLQGDLARMRELLS